MIVAILVHDAHRRQHLAGLLEAGGHRVLGCASAADLLTTADRAGFELLILDWSITDPPVERVLGALRDRSVELPVVALTPRDDERDAVAALTLGADDCVPWPPKAGELLARLAALSRRAKRSRASQLRVGRYSFDLDRRTASLDGAAVDLTQKEFDLAAHLFRHPGALLPRSELLSRIWGIGEGATTRTVDTHASRIRRKLRLDASAGWRLVPVYGCGYRLEPASQP